MTVPRFTVRRLMVAVAIVALLIYGELTRRLWVALSTDYRSRAELSRVVQAWYAGLAGSPMGDSLGKGQLDRTKRLAVHQRELARKYDRAARYPWLPVAPDPPEPE